jgi:hypothetical protein
LNVPRKSSESISITVPAASGPAGGSCETVPSGAVSVKVCVFEKTRSVSVLPAARPVAGQMRMAATTARRLVLSMPRR